MVGGDAGKLDAERKHVAKGSYKNLVYPVPIVLDGFFLRALRRVMRDSARDGWQCPLRHIHRERTLIVLHKCEIGQNRTFPCA